MIFHFTEKLRKKLKIGPLGKVTRETRPHLGWYANIFTAQRVQYILVTNAASLFSVVMYGRGVTDFNAFNNVFFHTLREHLEDVELRVIYERVIGPATGEFLLSKTVDRSVLGSMNDMVDMCRYHLTYEGDRFSPWELSKRINETPYSAIDYRSPNKVFADIPLA